MPPPEVASVFETDIEVYFTCFKGDFYGEPKNSSSFWVLTLGSGAAAIVFLRFSIDGNSTPLGVATFRFN